MGHTWKNESHLEEYIKLQKMGHTMKNGSLVEKLVTLGQRIALGKWGTLEKNASHLENESQLRK